MKKVMKGLVPLILAVPLLCSTAFAQDIVATVSLGDEDFSPLPELVDTTVKHDQFFKQDYSECELIGKPVNLSADVQGYVVTTKAACGWAAYFGPVWIVWQHGKMASSVLSDSAYQIDVLPEKHNGLPNLIVGYENAFGIHNREWQYDGKEYRLLNDPQEGTASK
ncbi:hypothetical protein [Budvicia diplopodorum]|uniref:hypothetical protein n=1 Tax=Budvicia diplopodorum TaxID=1119056 RepID=UPI00135744E9|nr:hypothetical protein [Budvicia diplopodorum]